MKTTQKSVSPKPSSGLSLIEVIASIALLAGILVSMLTAHARLVRQTQRSTLIRQATNLADDQLASWFVDRKYPLQGSGSMPDHPEFFWETQPIRRLNGLPNAPLVVRYTVQTELHGTKEILFQTELILEQEEQ